MKIVHVSDSRDYRGGENQLFYLLKGLKDLDDFRCSVIVQKGSELETKLLAENIETIGIEFSGTWNMQNILGLLKILRDVSPDLIAVHTSGAHSRVLTAEYLGRLNIPIVVHRRFPGKVNRLSYFKYRSSKVSHYIAISKYVARRLIEGGVHPQKIRVVYSGVLIPNKKQTGRDKPLTVGTVSALTSEKNLHFWIDVFRVVSLNMPEVRGIIAGKGPERDTLIKRIKQYGLEEKLYILPYDESIWKRFSVFLSTSRVEGLGTAILQALAYGIPVVAPEVGGIPEIIRDNYTGYLIDGWGVNLFADRVLALLRDTHKRLEFSKNARRFAEYFSVENMVSKTADVYREAFRG